MTILTSRRGFIKGLIGGAIAAATIDPVNLILPPTLEENAEAAQRLWVLDPTLKSAVYLTPFANFYRYQGETIIAEAGVFGTGASIEYGVVVRTGERVRVRGMVHWIDPQRDTSIELPTKADMQRLGIRV